jgi:ribosomal protein S5
MKTKDILIVHPSNNDEMNVIKAFFKALKIKFEVTQDSVYNPEFVEKIEKSRKQAAEGKTTKINLDDIWK